MLESACCPTYMHSRWSSVHVNLRLLCQHKDSEFAVEIEKILKWCKTQYWKGRGKLGLVSATSRPSSGVNNSIPTKTCCSCRQDLLSKSLVKISGANKRIAPINNRVKYWSEQHSKEIWWGQKGVGCLQLNVSANLRIEHNQKVSVAGKLHLFFRPINLARN